MFVTAVTAAACIRVTAVARKRCLTSTTSRWYWKFAVHENFVHVNVTHTGSALLDAHAVDHFTFGHDVIAKRNHSRDAPRVFGRGLGVSGERNFRLACCVRCQTR